MNAREARLGRASPAPCAGALSQVAQSYAVAQLGGTQHVGPDCLLPCMRLALQPTRAVGTEVAVVSMVAFGKYLLAKGMTKEKAFNPTQMKECLYG